MAVLQHFRFSPKITIVTVSLAAIMIYCSFWQWGRYLRKVELVATYDSHSTAPALPLTEAALASEDFTDLANKKVAFAGTYDVDRQLVVTNKKHASGPGHWLFTPLKLDGSEKYIMVSRGFIPFADLAPHSWLKYEQLREQDGAGVLKLSVKPYFLGPKNPPVGGSNPFQHKWFFEEIDKMANQFPYPVIRTAYLQRLGLPTAGEFPAQAVSIEVPPSTHFGYTIEWAILAFVTLTVGFVLQAFPWYVDALYKRRSTTNAESSKPGKQKSVRKPLSGW